MAAGPGALGAVSTVRIRPSDVGVEIDVDAGIAPPAFRIESDGVRFRLVQREATLAWGRVLPWWRGHAWARRATSALAIVPAIRASDVRAVAPGGWPRWLAEQLVAQRAWLRPGRWALTAFDRPLRDAYASRDPAAIPPPARDLGGALEREASFVAPFGLSGSGKVLALRAASEPGSARVRSWRKHARAGTLPPLLLGWIAGLDVYVLLDGHDRLLAATLEGVQPDVLGLYAVHEDAVSWTSADRDRARAHALARYARVFESEPRLSDRTRLEANQRLADAWNDHRRRRSTTITSYRNDLAERFTRELEGHPLPDEVRSALLR